MDIERLDLKYKGNIQNGALKKIFNDVAVMTRCVCLIISLSDYDFLYDEIKTMNYNYELRIKKSFLPQAPGKDCHSSYRQAAL